MGKEIRKKVHRCDTRGMPRKRKGKGREKRTGPKEGEENNNIFSC